MSTGFQCASCGQWHDELPLDFGFAEPDYVADLDTNERERSVKGVGDFRELLQEGETHHYIRGVLEIPILESDDVFCYGVWTTLSAANCEAAKAAYRANGEAGPFFGWLSNRIPHYPSTVNLRTNVHVRADVRPAIILEHTEHPLAIEQHHGITLERVKQIISLVLHRSA